MRVCAWRDVCVWAAAGRRGGGAGEIDGKGEGEGAGMRDEWSSTAFGGIGCRGTRARSRLRLGLATEFVLWDRVPHLRSRWVRDQFHPPAASRHRLTAR